LGEIADKKILLQSTGVKIDWELEEKLSQIKVGAVSDYMSFFIDGVPVGLLNGFYTDRSSFELKANGRGYAIFKDGEHFHDVTFLDKPLFFDLNTSIGTKMERLCKMVAPGFPIIYMNRGCMYWGPSQCKFCVVGYIDTEAKKDPYEVAEVVSEGVEEGAIKTHVALTAGAFPDDKGIKLLGEATEAIKDLVDIPVSVNAEPPRDLKHIKWLSNADSVYFNLEVFDPFRRKEILPGKSEFEVNYYDSVFKECFEYFEENQVASVLLTGLEDKDSYLHGIEHLTAQGVMPVPVPFYPVFHSRLENVDPPDAEMMMDVYVDSGDIMDEFGLDPFKSKAGFMRGGAIFSLKEVLKGI
jgi:hypothetical protein